MVKTGNAGNDLYTCANPDGYFLLAILEPGGLSPRGRDAFETSAGGRAGVGMRSHFPSLRDFGEFYRSVNPPGSNVSWGGGGGGPGLCNFCSNEAKYAKIGLS